MVTVIILCQTQITQLTLLSLDITLEYNVNVTHVALLYFFLKSWERLSPDFKESQVII